jgi:YD repeat-containing protein
LLRTIHSDYSQIVALNCENLKIRETVTLDNGLVTKTELDPTTYQGQLAGGSGTTTACSPNYIEKREFDYGAGSPGPLLRKTHMTWGFSTPNVPFGNRKTAEQIYNGAGTLIAQTTYEYDNYTQGLAASGATQHDPAFGTNYTTRGNVTAVNRWRSTDGATLTTRMQYDDAGNVLSTTDPLGHNTSTSYGDVWGNSTCAPTGGSAAAYPTQVTDSAGHITKQSYNSCTGTVATATDPNNQVTSFAYDLADRLTQVNFPDLGRTSTCFSEVSGGSCYSSSYPLKIQRTQKITSSLNKVSTSVLDGLARVIQTQLNSDPDFSSGDKTDTTYDALGRV